MSQLQFEALSEALVQTLLMVGTSSLLTLLLGLPLALLLVTTSPGGLIEAGQLHRALGAVVNAFRSTPFIILLVALIPVTRLIIGTSIGLWAAVVPLTASGVPFFARVAEVSLREVPRGLVEAAQAMGARRWQIVWHVLLPESRPSIIRGYTLTLISLVGLSAMAGVVGAGGLGDLAIRYGYQRFDTGVMVWVVVVLLAMVTLVQLCGDRLARRVSHQA